MTHTKQIAGWRDYQPKEVSFLSKVWHFIIGTIGLSAFWALVLGGR
jgi:hypothetical protein